ncbi:MAG: response regulator [Acetobacteraceae bacterium]|nr:response regulator [Acetobacteraceae bacterium]
MSTESRRIVAVVDDDPAVRESLRFLLETAGHAVETYDSGVRFLSEAEPGRLACLVLDQQMPQITGIDLLARLRARGLATPTLIVASAPGPALTRRATELGAAGVLEKPLTQDDLVARVAAAVT